MISNSWHKIYETEAMTERLSKKLPDHPPPLYRLNHSLESASTEYSSPESSPQRVTQSPNTVIDEQLHCNSHISTSGPTDITNRTSSNNTGNGPFFANDCSNAAVFSDNKPRETTIENENSLCNEFFRNIANSIKSSDKSENNTSSSNNTNIDPNKQPRTSSPITQLTQMESSPQQQQHEVRINCTALTREQINVLEREFNTENYTSRQRKSELAQKLFLQELTIMLWFKTRRAKYKRQRMAAGCLDTQMKSSLQQREIRRCRTKLTKEQLNRLELEFNKQNFVTYTGQRRLAQELNLEESTITYWFKTRRRLKKRQMMAVACPHTQMESLPQQQQQQQPQPEIRRRSSKFTSEQIDVLENEFSRRNYTSRPRRCQLAKELNLQELTIKYWFQNRRKKDKLQRMAVAWPRVSTASESARHSSILPSRDHAICIPPRPLHHVPVRPADSPKLAASRIHQP